MAEKTLLGAWPLGRPGWDWSGSILYPVILVIPFYEIDSRVLRTKISDSIVTKPERDQVGPSFEITGGVTPPHSLICAPVHSAIYLISAFFFKL